MIRLPTVAFLVVVMSHSVALAGGKSRAAREAAEYLLKRFSKETAEESVETLTAKIARYSAKYGDDAVEAVKKAGPRSFKLLDDAGENAPHVARLLKQHGSDAVRIASKPRSLALFARYGDEAAEAMIKHPGAAGPLIEQFGSPAARAIKNVSPRNARRIGMMADDGTLAAAGHADEMLDVIAKYGDRAADFVWRHKGAIAVSAVAASFLADPEPFIDGTRDLAEIAVRPADTAVKEISRGVAEGTQWTLVIVGVAGVLMAVIAWRRAPFRNRKHKRLLARRRKAVVDPTDAPQP